jgi:hypothetical protein
MIQARRTFISLLLIVGLIPSGITLASENLEDLLGGFGEEQEEKQQSGEQQSEEVEKSMQDHWFDLSTILRLQSTYSFSHDSPESGEPDYRGNSLLRGSVELTGDVDKWGWKGRLGIKGFYDLAYEIQGEKDLYTSKYLDEYEKEIELGEAYIQGSLSENLDVKIGRQIVVWGKSDTIRVTDILNPLDSRQPGLVDIRDLKLPVTMSKLDYYFGNWNLSTLLIHEPRFDKIPVFNGDFFPGTMALPREEKPVTSLENQQLGMALNGIFTGWDVSFYGASVFDRRAHLEREASPVREHARVLMLGVAANVALGNWLWKTEAAYWHGLHYSNLPSEEKKRFDLLGAFEYHGFSETVISFEIVNRHILGFDERLKLPADGEQEDQLQYALRFVRDFNNDTLHFTLLHVSYDLFVEDGGFSRCQLEYDVTDGLSITGGVVFYNSGDFLPFQDIGDNDRVLFEVEYRF